MRKVGQIIQQRREAMGLSQTALSREMGNYPSASLMSRIESGDVDLTLVSATKYARALRMPLDPFLNAAGIATLDQQNAALEELARIVGEDVPVYVSLPVLDAEHPDAPPVVTRTREMRKVEDAFIVDLMRRTDEPYMGEVLAVRGRKPKDGQGVVAEVSGKLGAWTYHTGRPIGEWLESGTQEKVTRFKVIGVIAQVRPPVVELA